jgi:competence protein ComFC
MMLRIFGFLKNVFRAYLMPCICAYCKKFLSTTDIFCVDCKNKIFRVVSKQIDITPSISITVFAISDYKDPLRKLILGKSWSDSLASHYLGQLLWEMTPIQNLDYDVIVPIPLHWTRYAWRGFNQAHEMARVISKNKKVPIEYVIKRTKKTVYQSLIPSSARIENVKNAFALNPVHAKKYEGAHILLVDDLLTTGSTLRAAAKMLLPLKPRKISAVVVCRVI